MPQPTASVVIDDAELDAKGTFSPMVIGLFVVCAVVGVVFGYAGATTMYNNDMVNLRVSDAETLLEQVKPKVAAFADLMAIVEKLDGTNADFEAAAKMKEVDFAIQGNAFGSNRLLLGPVAIDNVTSYAADTTLLLTMLREHDRLTNRVDKEELEKLAEENKVLENDNFGVVFDYKYILSRGGEEGYVPKPGQLVINKGPTEDNAKVNVEYLGAGRGAEVEMQGFIPIDKSQILKSGGGNAMTRYQWRVSQIQYQAIKVAKYVDNVVSSLDVIAKGDSEGEPPAGGAPAGEAASE